jgi:hypothetical protein
MELMTAWRVRYFVRMILQILQLTVLDIATHKIGNPVSLLTADLNENDSSTTSTTKDVLQPKINCKYIVVHP